MLSGARVLLVLATTTLVSATALAAPGDPASPSDSRAPGDEPPLATTPPAPAPTAASPVSTEAPAPAAPPAPPAPPAPGLIDLWVGPRPIAPLPAPPDALRPTAIAELAVGGALTVLGPVLWATSSTTEACGALAGCFTVSSDQAWTQREAGASLAGLGVGLAISGGLTLTIAALDPLARGSARRNPAAAVAGHLLVSAGAGLVGSGLGFGAAREPVVQGWPFFLAGGILTAGGLPLLIFGARAGSDLEDRVRALPGVAARPADLAPTFIRVGPGGVAATWTL